MNKTKVFKLIKVIKLLKIWIELCRMKNISLKKINQNFPKLFNKSTLKSFKNLYNKI